LTHIREQKSEPDRSMRSQSVDRVSALPGFEKARKSKKRSLQIHERTWTYAIGFAGFFDDESKNLFAFFSF